ncbi:hypothetical protein B0H17DRAFT_1131010 [Mycena rosella]|uniref:Uncharacterized protein n=1 Tax=Mycena rosella TaxID=1033263 RepID=A0AAD7GL82_MYCRO|nr:hypothetical protein B0H17DRAFT_1131010 [Mycena rosella]
MEKLGLPVFLIGVSVRWVLLPQMAWVLVPLMATLDFTDENRQLWVSVPQMACFGWSEMGFSTQIRRDYVTIRLAAGRPHATACYSMGPLDGFGVIRTGGGGSLKQFHAV